MPLRTAGSCIASVLNRHRRPIRNIIRLYVDLGDISQLEAFLNEPSDDPAYDELVMEQIRASLKAASETDRKIINMRYGLELSLREIAAALEYPINTVKSRLYRFLAKAQKNHKKEGSGGFHEKQ